MRRFLLWSVLVLSLAGIAGAFGWSRLRRPPASSVPSVPASYGSVPSFQLTDQNKQPFDSAQLHGKVWVADFIFTSCAGNCPLMSTRMASLQRRLPAEILLVSVTVDPKRDTPPVLADYARRYGAQPGRWFFLTGPEQEIFRLVQQGFRLGVAEGGGPEEPVIHSVRFVLVDRGGKIRGYYDSSDPGQVEQLIRDVGDL